MWFRCTLVCSWFSVAIASFLLVLRGFVLHDQTFPLRIFSADNIDSYQCCHLGPRQSHYNCSRGDLVREHRNVILEWVLPFSFFRFQLTISGMSIYLGSTQVSAPFYSSRQHMMPRSRSMNMSFAGPSCVESCCTRMCH